MFGEADLRLLTTIAANVGVAIQNARLYEEARRRANEMAALAEIGHDIATTVDLEPVLERIVTQAKQLLRVRDIALYMRDPDDADIPGGGGAGPVCRSDQGAADPGRARHYRRYRPEPAWPRWSTSPSWIRARCAFPARRCRPRSWRA